MHVYAGRLFIFMEKVILPMNYRVGNLGGAI